jgi:hypothetical protein
MKDKTAEASDGTKTGKAKEGKALIDHLAKIEPHMVKLEYAGDPESFGLHIFRAIEFYSDADLDMGTVGFAERFDYKKKDILATFHSGTTDAVMHYDAETEFAATVNRLLGIAGNRELTTGVKDAAVARAAQVRDFNTAWARMRKQLKTYSADYTHGEEFYRKQIVLCAKAAFGVTLSRAALKNMSKQDEWRAALEKRYHGSPARGQDPSGVTDNLLKSLIATMQAQTRFRKFPPSASNKAF